MHRIEFGQNLNNLDISQLIRGIAEGDEQAFNKFFDLYYPKLIQIALGFAPGILAAQEIVSDVIYKILKKPKNLLKVYDFDNYIFVAVRNQSRSYLRKNRHFLKVDSLDSTDDFILPIQHRNHEDSLISDELYELVYDFIQQLPPKRKVIFQFSCMSQGSWPRLRGGTRRFEGIIFGPVPWAFHRCLLRR